MTERKRLELLITHFQKQAKEDAERTDRFMVRLGEVARAAQAERQAKRGKKQWPR